MSFMTANFHLVIIGTPVVLYSAKIYLDIIFLPTLIFGPAFTLSFQAIFMSLIFGLFGGAAIIKLHAAGFIKLRFAI